MCNFKLPEMLELLGDAVAEQQLAGRNNLQPHTERRIRPHHRPVVHIEPLQSSRRQQPVRSVKIKGVRLDGLSVGRMSSEIHIAGVLWQGGQLQVLQISCGGAVPRMPFRPRLNEQELVSRLHGVGEGAPGAVEAVPVLGEAGEVLDG